MSFYLPLFVGNLFSRIRHILFRDRLYVRYCKFTVSKCVSFALLTLQICHCKGLGHVDSYMGWNLNSSTKKITVVLDLNMHLYWVREFSRLPLSSPFSAHKYCLLEKSSVSKFFFLNYDDISFSRRCYLT